MKNKRTVSVVIIIAILFTMFVVPTKAAVAQTLWVNGEDLLADSDKTITCGEGTVSFDSTTNTLTLNNAMIKTAKTDSVDTTQAYGIYIEGFSTMVNLVVNGENGVYLQEASGVNNTALFMGENTAGLKISGSGNLNVVLSKGVFGIATYGNLSIENTKINVHYNSIGSSDYGDSSAFCSILGNVIMDGATIEANGAHEGIYAEKAVMLQNKSNFVGKNLVTYGMISVSDNVNVSDSIVLTDAKIFGSGKIEISENSEVEIKDSMFTLKAENVYIAKSKIVLNCTADTAIVALKNVTIADYSDVQIKGEIFAESGIYSEGNILLSNSFINISGFRKYGIVTYDKITVNCCDLYCNGGDYAMLSVREDYYRSDNSMPTKSVADMITLQNCYVSNDSELYNTGWKYDDWDEYWMAECYYAVSPKTTVNVGTIVKQPAKTVKITPDVADYSAVDAAIAKVENLIEDDYVDFSEVNAAINAVVREKNVLEQAEVDKMAADIEGAIAALELQVKKVKFTKKKIKVKLRKKVLLTLKVKLTPGASKLNNEIKKVKWSIDKKGKKVVKFVKKANKLTGKLSAKITAVKKGKAKITCKAPNGKKAVCTVIVK